MCIKMRLRPTIVCLCGSTRFMEAFFTAGWELSLLGQIVLSVGVFQHKDLGDTHRNNSLATEISQHLDTLHLRKIDLADWILVLNIAGYYSDSTGREIRYTKQQKKPVVMLTAHTRPATVPKKDTWETREEIVELTRLAATKEK